MDMEYLSWTFSWFTALMARIQALGQISRKPSLEACEVVYHGSVMGVENVCYWSHLLLNSAWFLWPKWYTSASNRNFSDVGLPSPNTLWKSARTAAVAHRAGNNFGRCDFLSLVSTTNHSMSKNINTKRRFQRWVANCEVDYWQYMILWWGPFSIYFDLKQKCSYCRALAKERGVETSFIFL